MLSLTANESYPEYAAIVQAAERDRVGPDLETHLRQTAAEIAALEAEDEALPRPTASLWDDEDPGVEQARREITLRRQRPELRFSVLVRGLPSTDQRCYWQDWV